MGRERAVEQSWAEWEGDLERNRAITSGQYINTHHLKVQLRAVYVCVCLSCYSGAQLTGTTCQRIGPLLSPSGSGAQREWLPGGTEEWVKCHRLELAAARGGDRPAASFHQGWSAMIQQPFPLGSLYPGPGVSGRCTHLTRGCADARAGMFWDTSAWSAHS